ncbi:MAG: NfeD family protein [Prevotella sp.]|uniref:NfeD family protein n=1 Tax=Prevotella sp. TaxID=59823 RepID=UPI0039FB0DA8
MIDYFAQNLWLAWLLISLLCLLLELTNGDFFIVCFAVGGLFASISSVFTDSLTIQIIVFAITTLLSIFFLRPVALRWFHKGEDRRVSNVDALIGRIGRVTEPIETNGYGRVQIDGDSWKAKTRDGHPVENGMKARVLSIDSIIITVEEA